MPMIKDYKVQKDGVLAASFCDNSYGVQLSVDYIREGGEYDRA